MEGLLNIPGMTPGGIGIWGILAWLWISSLKTWYDSRKLTNDERQANREGFTDQVKNLQAENRSLRKDLQDANISHEEYRRLCHDETDALRRHVARLEDDVAGFKRQLSAIGSSAMEQVLDSGVVPPPTVARMLTEIRRDKI